MRAALVAGVLSGIAGLLTFLTLHHFWIRPIWFILPIGFVIAALGGLAVGWSYSEIKAGLLPQPWTALALMAIIAAILAPSILLAQLRPSLINIQTGALVEGASVGGAVARFVFELLLTATVTGGLIGWWIGQTPRASAATALAGFIFALGPGHNIPFLGNTPGTGKGVGLLAAIVVVSAVVLVIAEAWLMQRPAPVE